MSRTRIWVYATCLAYFFNVFALRGPDNDAQTVTVVYNFGSVSVTPVSGFTRGLLRRGRTAICIAAQYQGGGSGQRGRYVLASLRGGTANLRCTVSPATAMAPFRTGGLTLGTDGNFYGTAYCGGSDTARFGTVFKMTSDGGLSRPFTPFTDGCDGALPIPRPSKASMETFTAQLATSAMVRMRRDMARFTGTHSLRNFHRASPI